MGDDDSEKEDVGYPNFSKRLKVTDQERRFLIDEKFVAIHSQLSDMEFRLLKKMQSILTEIQKNAGKRDK